MVFAWALPANVPLYQPLANMFLLGAVDAAVAWARRLGNGGHGATGWLIAAGVLAGLSLGAKHTTGVLALGAVGIIAIAATAHAGRHSSRLLASAWFTAASTCVAVVALLLIPVAWAGGWGKFAEYAALAKGTYLRVGRVPYYEEVGTFLGSLRPGPAFDPLQAVKGQPLLLPVVLIAGFVAAWRVRRSQPVAAATVAALALAELATLFPRADIDHVIPAVPGFLVAILFAWHVLAERDAAGVRSRGRAAGIRVASAVCLLVVTVACAVRLSASVGALVSPARTWSALPHLVGVLVPRAREAEMAASARSLRAAAVNGSLFLLMPNAGLYYLVSGVENPTPFDYPLVTAFGRSGEADLAVAIASGRIDRVCLSPVTGTMAPERLQRAVVSHLVARENLGPCTLRAR